jgi:hypothetical protein
MVLRIHALFASAALVAALGVVAVVHAQEETPVGIDAATSVPVGIDAATSAAIAQWRVQSLSLVNPALQDTVAAMYADRPVDPSMVNAASIARAQAEQAAWASLDKASMALIKNFYYSQGREGDAGGDTADN